MNENENHKAQASLCADILKRISELSDAIDAADETENEDPIENLLKLKSQIDFIDHLRGHQEYDRSDEGAARYDSDQKFRQAMTKYKARLDEFGYEDVDDY